MATLIRSISKSGGVVCTAIDSTDIAAEAERIHKTSATVTAALGRLLTAASLMGVMLKKEENSITLRLQGDGPAGLLIAVTDGLGNVRGDVENPVVEIPLNGAGKLDVAGAVGHSGSLSVVKDLGLKDPYVGQVPIVSGEIAEDITNYYAVSEQTPTVCALGVLVNPDLTVQAAGGFLIQLLPGALEEDIDRLERNIGNMPSVTQMLTAGASPEDMCRRALAEFDPQMLETVHTAYRCTCSKQRVERALLSIGRRDLEEMIAEEEHIEVGCHFCGKKYDFSNADLRKLLEKAGQNG
ncbi:MAG: Hsp33 family molecular chaperone HslO [Oscillospiraceae bacterium]|nr:Hsp33 family molecular chaperone HslO [Oscillospiraceae bacterium]